MKATDLIKSISKSVITAKDMDIVTAYHNQTVEQFLDDNFGSESTIDAGFKMPVILDSQDYLCIFNGVKLVTPDGKSELRPDFKVMMTGATTVELYKFN